MTGSASESVDPAHWVGVIGGTVMLAVVALCSLSLMSPWWTEHKELPGRKETVEVSLWVRSTRFELEGGGTEENCEKACDITKIGSAKVRETSAMWSEVCAQPTPELAPDCQRLWIARIGALLCWFFALLYSAFAMLNFWGAGLPSSIRVPAAIKIWLGLCCLVACVMALIIASLMDVRLSPTAPGTKPKETDPAPQKVGFNGLGFVCTVASLVLSVIGTGIAYLALNIDDHVQLLEELEAGRALADINHDKAPPLWHQIGKSPACKIRKQDIGKPEHILSLNGHWSKADIEDDILTWPNEVTEKLEILSHRSCILKSRETSETRQAEVEDDGQLHWDDGDIWVRKTEKEALHWEPAKPALGSWM